jgi:hypothetical protein
MTGCILLALLLHGTVVMGFLLRYGGPDWFLHLGHEFPPALRLARSELGENVAIPHVIGHDGKSFWVLARDPFLTQGKDLARHLDYPLYRAQRIAYSALASPWRLGGEQLLLWGLLVTNLAAVLLGTAATTRLAASLGAGQLACFAFSMNPAVVVGVLFDLSDVLGLAALVWSLSLWLRGRALSSAVFGGIAVLARETSLLSLAAVGLLDRGSRTRDRLLLSLVPAAIAFGWMVYARARLGTGSESADLGSTLGRQFEPPFRGYVEVLGDSVRAGSWSTAVAAVAALAVGLLAAWRWWRRRTTLTAAALPYAFLAPFLSAPVLDVPINSLRAVGPAITFLIIDYLSGGTRQRDPEVVPDE